MALSGPALHDKVHSRSSSRARFLRYRRDLQGSVQTCRTIGRQWTDRWWVAVRCPHAIAGSIPVSPPVLGSPSSQAVPGKASSSSGAFAVDDLADAVAGSVRYRPGAGVAIVAGSARQCCSACGCPSRSMSRPTRLQEASQVSPRCWGRRRRRQCPASGSACGSFAVDELPRSCRRHPRCRPGVGVRHRRRRCPAVRSPSVPSQSMAADPRSCRKHPGVTTGVGVAIVAWCPAVQNSSGSFAVDEQTDAVARGIPVSPPVLGSPSSQAVPGSAVPQRFLRSR